MDATAAVLPVNAIRSSSRSRVNAHALPLFEPLADGVASSRGPDTRSPVEQHFHHEAVRLLPGMQCQYPEPPYHIDFAWPQYRLAVEVDGHDYHATQRQREYDNHRGRELTRRGWTVIRFTGSEITRDVATCIEEVRTVIVALMALQGRFAMQTGAEQ